MGLGAVYFYVSLPFIALAVLALFGGIVYFALAAGHVGKVDVHLIDPAVFHHRGYLGNDRFESL